MDALILNEALTDSDESTNLAIDNIETLNNISSTAGNDDSIGEHSSHRKKDSSKSDTWKEICAKIVNGKKVDSQSITTQDFDATGTIALGRDSEDFPLIQIDPDLKDTVVFNSSTIILDNKKRSAFQYDKNNGYMHIKADMFSVNGVLNIDRKSKHMIVNGVLNSDRIFASRFIQVTPQIVTVDSTVMDIPIERSLILLNLMVQGQCWVRSSREVPQNTLVKVILVSSSVDPKVEVCYDAGSKVLTQMGHSIEFLVGSEGVLCIGGS